MSESQPSGPIQWGPPAAPSSSYPPPAAPSASAQYPPNMGASRFCVYCATPIPNEAYACPRCGRPQPSVTVPLPAQASMPLPYGYPAPNTYPLPPQMAVFMAPAGVATQVQRTNPTGMIVAALGSALGLVGFFFLPFGVATNLAGPALAQATAQNASIICAAAPQYSDLQNVCTYFSIGGPVMWAVVGLAGLSLLSALVGAVSANSSTKSAASSVTAAGILSLIGFGYLYFGGQSAVQALQAAGAITVIGYGTGGWLMIAGAVIAVLGGIVQRASN